MGAGTSSGMTANQQLKQSIFRQATANVNAAKAIDGAAFEPVNNSQSAWVIDVPNIGSARVELTQGSDPLYLVWSASTYVNGENRWVQGEFETMEEAQQAARRDMKKRING